MLRPMTMKAAAWLVSLLASVVACTPGHSDGDAQPEPQEANTVLVVKLFGGLAGLPPDWQAATRAAPPGTPCRAWLSLPQSRGSAGFEVQLLVTESALKRTEDAAKAVRGVVGTSVVPEPRFGQATIHAASAQALACAT